MDLRGVCAREATAIMAISVFALLGVVTSLASGHALADQGQRHNQLVVGVFTPCCGSGYMSFLAAVEVAAPNGDLERLYIQYFGPHQGLPALGGRCDFWGEVRHISGSTIEGAVDPDVPSFLVSGFKCAYVSE